MITIEEFKKLYNAIDGEPEFKLTFSDATSKYEIIKYPDHASFQRCGYYDGSGEIDYDTLDNLLSSNLIDGINLERDWGSIVCIEFNHSFIITDSGVFQEIEEVYEVDLS